MSQLCNHCGQVIKDDGPIYEDFLKVEKKWGYFSDKDLEIHTFYLCECCYDQIIKNFKIPVAIKNNNEAI